VKNIVPVIRPVETDLVGVSVKGVVVGPELVLVLLPIGNAIQIYVKYVKPIFPRIISLLKIAFVLTL